MSIKIAEEVRLLWDEKGTKQLKMSKRPLSDFENGELAINKKHRSWRPESTYSDLGIDIIDHEMWGHLDKGNT